jgi:hypothetical protein
VNSLAKEWPHSYNSNYRRARTSRNLVSGWQVWRWFILLEKTVFISSACSCSTRNSCTRSRYGLSLLSSYFTRKFLQLHMMIRWLLILPLTWNVAWRANNLLIPDQIHSLHMMPALDGPVQVKLGHAVRSPVACCRTVLWHRHKLLSVGTGSACGSSTLRQQQQMSYIQVNAYPPLHYALVVTKFTNTLQTVKHSLHCCYTLKVSINRTYRMIKLSPNLFLNIYLWLQFSTIRLY